MKIERTKMVPLLFMVLLIKTIVQIALNETVGNNISKAIIYSIEVLLIVLILNDIISGITSKSVAVIIFFVILMVFGAFISEADNRYYYSLIGDFLLKCVPMYFMGKAIALNKNSNYYFKYAPVIASIAYVVIFTKGTYLLNRDTKYSQELGYALLGASIIAFYFFMKGKLHYVIWVFITVVGIISSGARGPFFCAVFAYALIMMRILDIRKIKNFLIFIAVIASMSLLYVERIKIISSLTNYIKRNGFSSRFFDVLRARTMFQSRGRSSIWYGAVQEIIKHHVVGTGIFRDRQFIYEHATRTDRLNSAHFLYEHNIFLEWLLQFGIIIGTIMSIALVVLLIRMYLRCRDTENYDIAMVLLGIGFFPLLISGSYLESEYFYFLLGYAIRICSEKRFAVVASNPAAKEDGRNDSDMSYNHSA